MDPKTSYSLRIHKHPLFPSVRLFDKCGACHLSTDAVFDKGYTCKVCNVCFHKECAEAPFKFNYPSHPHCSYLIKFDADEYKRRINKTPPPCTLCGEYLCTTPWYGCFFFNRVCDFGIDFTCALKPPPLAIEKPLCHDHPLVFFKKRGIHDKKKSYCEVCKKLINGPSYTCADCDVYFHVDCNNFSKEVNHPHHSNHPLKLVSSDTLREDLHKRCATIIPYATPQLSLTCSVCCGTLDKENKVIYYCSICNFIACLACTKSPPPLTIEHFKTHKHPLAIFSRRITFICDVCGLEMNTGRPYFCLQCDFVTHLQCINLPRVININRHSHRVYFTYHLGIGYSKCGICRGNLCQYRGAYSCKICPNYAVHSQCATGRNVWDGVELEGTLDTDTEDIQPFKVVGVNLINHFSHKKHSLKLYNDNYILNDEKWIRCEACIYPLGFGSFYACEECNFALHEKCANLPMKKRFVFSTALYSLKVNIENVVNCKRCEMLHDGFKYTSEGGDDVDVHCGSLSEPLVHESHVHPLYFEANHSKYYCCACKNKAKDYALRCDGCKFDLCFQCANLPLKIKNLSHEHALTLCYGEMAFEKTWCERCEREIDPNKWFYMCSECGVILHVRCVIEDFSCLMLDLHFHTNWERYKVACNNHSTRPSCYVCKSRCSMVNIIYDEKNNRYICSRSCLLRYNKNSIN